MLNRSPDLSVAGCAATTLLSLMLGAGPVAPAAAQEEGREYAGAGRTGSVERVLARFPPGTQHTVVMVPMRDHVRLATDVFVPPGTARPQPAAVVRTPYGRRSVTTYASRTAQAGGVALVVQDCRGSGDSEGAGTFAPETSDNEIADGYDCVEWIAAQPWCNGRVGLFGGSGHGMAAAMAFLSKAPHLVVVNPANSAGNTAVYWAFENGVRRWLHGWLSFRGLTPSREEPKPTLLTYDPTRWEQVLAEAATGNRTVYIGDDGWFNIFQDAGLDLFERFATNTTVCMDVRPRTHKGPTTALRFPASQTRLLPAPDFFAILKGATPPPSRLTYYVMGDARQAPDATGNTIRVTDRWPPPHRPLTLFLRQNGALSSGRPTEERTARDYDYDPRQPAPTLGGGFSYGSDAALSSEPLDQRPLQARPDVLRFATAPLAAPLEIAGKPKADLYVSSTASDTLFVVKMVDIYPEGYEALLREGAFMARYRNGLDKPAPLETNRLTRLTFSLNSTAVAFARGHRIGVYITSSSTPAYEVHPNTYDPVVSYDRSPIAHQCVSVSASAPSAIILPVVSGDLPDTP